MNMRTLALPALAASVVLTLSACDPTTPAAQPTDAAAAADAAPAGTGTTHDAPVPAGGGKVTIVAPAADRTPAVPTAAPPSSPPSPKASASSPASSPVPSASGTPAVVTGAPDLELASYDKQSGKAVLAVADAGKGTPSPSATAAVAAAVKPGQVIDSPPSAAAPQGALLAVTEVKPAAAGKVEVATRPATISELLGKAWADIKTALDPHRIQVTPKLKDVKVSYVPRSDGAQGAASAALQLDADDTIDLPGGAKAQLTGSIELDPSVSFSYQGGGLLSLDRAKVGFDLGAHAKWRVTAGLDKGTGPVKIPIATLTSPYTVMVGTVPVVITVNVTVYAEVSADGKVTVDVAQAADGDWAIHADYTKAGGWSGGSEPLKTTVSPVRAAFAGNAHVRSGLVADGSVALYDSVGVKATVEPYLKAAVEGSVTIDSSAGKPLVQGKADVSGGIEIDGAVLGRIAVFGTPLLEKDLPFKIYQHEWPIASGTYTNAGASPVPKG
ncbi:hypothetical protein PUR71_37655 [Streptomyces sp. SP17BM10]|uniref:hypothetical protein n=1 Tax=Streptomyces sp. SP17BM10 TaxID=3002530 RepID=UPI002E7AAAB4|nr:hypothetical protein [Streptomyces sp. SP17BM10]MEE1788587.1 hypothetical protein [Streptomyces sp. SP17BM10]